MDFCNGSGGDSGGTKGTEEELSSARRDIPTFLGPSPPVSDDSIPDIPHPRGEFGD